MMQTKHKISEPVRAYLLGTIDDAEAVKLETRYFTDPSVLHWVQAVESTLIEDYFENRLSSKDKRLFESRYLEVPALRNRVEEVRRQHQLAKSGSVRAKWLNLRWVAAGILLCLIGLGAWFQWSTRRAQPALVARAPLLAPLAVVSLRLSPGVSKGSTEELVELAVPARSRVSLTLELPGRRTIDSYLVRILTIVANGKFSSVWTSEAVRSVLQDGGSNVTVELDASIFRPADYVVQTIAVTGEILETYEFRVNANLP
jgi:hypothetical protein